ncbi:MAG: M23 family metallopeptidase [bacterium]|nr:M23 family metallopeptidase [bacterium]
MSLLEDIQDFSSCISRYSTHKVTFCAQAFEAQKKTVTKKIIKRRGQLSRPTVHLGMAGIVAGVLVGGSFMGGSSATTPQYPEADAATPQEFPTAELAAFSGDSLDSMNTQTLISDKPRDQILEYVVKPGETLSQIAENFGIDSNTIKWANDLEDKDTIKPGQTLKILPVVGVAHQVVRGDTVYSIAKKYDTNPQAIVDFPFNDIGENLGLRIGQVIIVPDGTPVEKPRPSKAPVKVVEGPTSTVKPGSKPGQGNGIGTGSFMWPVRGLITQSFKSYHPGIDIAGSSGDPVVAADGGEVIVSGWTDNTGYGNRVMIKHPNGMVTLYGHLQSNSNKVKSGDKVSKGQVIGLRGSTGRSTGPHLHFEVRKSGASNQNPMNYLK